MKSKFLFLTAFIILSLSVFFNNLIIMCLDIFLYMFHVSGYVEPFPFVIIFYQSGNFPVIIFFNFFATSSLSYTSGTQISHIFS